MNIKNLLFTVITAGLLSVFSSCAVVKAFKINEFNGKQQDALPDTFRVEMPLQTDAKGRFMVEGKINGIAENFSIDNHVKVSLYKTDSLNKRNAVFYGNHSNKFRNLYGQQYRQKLYYFENFSISDLSFGTPLFAELDTVNAIYKVTDNNIIGDNILENLNWKFDVDNEKLILFDNNNTAETNGYQKVEKGLKDNSIKINFPEIDKTEKFTLDLGFDSEMFINKNIFNQLKEKYEYKKIVGTTDSIFFFENLTVNIEGIDVPNCVVGYKPRTNLNLIGVRFMQRLNFILNYDYNRKEHLPRHTLWLKTSKNIAKSYFQTPMNQFDFSIARGKKARFGISLILIGGTAQKAGLMLNDAILLIDDIDLKDRELSFVKDYIKDKEKIKIKVQRNNELLEFELKI